MLRGPVIALIDGEHHPSAVRSALDHLAADRGLAGVVFCGGEEKAGRVVLESAEEHYGHPVTIEPDPGEALRRLAGGGEAQAVVDLADEPVLPPAAKLRLAALALHLGLPYEAPGLRLTPPHFDHVDFEGPKLSVIGTRKRTGKTAVAGHWAGLLRDAGIPPVIVSMGRGGPAEPQLAGADTALDALMQIAAEGRHAASDYLEDAALARVPSVGSRRVGGGLAGEPFESNFLAGAALAASLSPAALVFEGSGSCIPPVHADRTVCVVGDRESALTHLGSYRLLRADLALVMDPDPTLRADVAALSKGPALSCALRPEPAEALPEGARVAVFSTSDSPVSGVEAVVASPNLARRSTLDADLQRAEAERCDVYLTELKAAAIDTVARHAVRTGARVIFLRNVPSALDADLDAELMGLYGSV